MHGYVEPLPIIPTQPELIQEQEQLTGFKFVAKTVKTFIASLIYPAHDLIQA